MIQASLGYYFTILSVKMSQKSKKRHPSGDICCVVGCHNTYSNKPGISLYSFPRETKDPERRLKWIQAIKRLNKDDTVWTPGIYARVCSDHFLSGKPVYHPASPDYVPNKFPPSYNKRSGTDQDEKRFQRAMSRSFQKKSSNYDTECHSESGKDILLSINNDTENHNVSEENLTSCNSQQDTEDSMKTSNSSHTFEVACQTDDVEVSSEQFIFTCTLDDNSFGTMAMIPSNETLRSPSSTETASVMCGPSSRSIVFQGYETIKSMKDDNISDLCGIRLQVFAVLLACLNRTTSRNTRKNEIKIEDRLLLFLMKLKLGISFTALGSIFGVCCSTSSRVFHQILLDLCVATQEWVSWLPDSLIQKTMPEIFQTYYPKCRAIIDCFEIKTEIPNLAFQKNHMYSNYKNAYTAKYLVAISPGGYIMYVSEGYGGRTTDCAITLDCGILKHIQPGDEIMADKGFPAICTTLEKHGAILIMPPFASGQEQFSETEMNETYQIASVRIHVERMIQRIRTFDILNRRVGVELFSWLDHIVNICCVLANLQPPIIRENND